MMMMLLIMMSIMMLVMKREELRSVPKASSRPCRVTKMQHLRKEHTISTPNRVGTKQASKMTFL
jgi:hypothetical protein